MAKIFGNYEIHGELYLKSLSQQPFPLLLSTDTDGKVTFVNSVNGVTASFPIIIDNQTNIVGISHANSGWVNKTTLTGSNIISNLTVTNMGHLVNWSTRQLTPQDIGAEPEFNKGTFVNGNGIVISGDKVDRLVKDGSLTFSHAITTTQSSISNINRTVIQSISLDADFGHVTQINSLNLDNVFDDKYVRYDINSQNLNTTQRSNARTNIQALSKDTNDSRTGTLIQTGDVDIIGNLDVISGDILLTTSKKIDTIETNGVLNIGTSNSNIINIGKSGSTVNIIGELLYQNVTNLEVTDKLIRINKGGITGSGNNAGIEIEENNLVAGYFKTNGSRDGWISKIPAKQAELNLSHDLLTNVNRTQKFQNEDGTIALIGTGLLDDRYIRNISVGNLSPLFTSATASTTPTETITFTLSNASANTFFGNNTASATIPSYNTLQALTKTDDDNVTITLGGTPQTALAKAVSMTLGWQGQLSVGRGGTGASTLTGVVIGNGNSPFGAVPGTANQILRRNSSNTAYEFSLIQTNNIDDSQVTYSKIQNVTADRLLGRLTTNGVVQELTSANIRTLINVEDGAQVNVATNLAYDSTTRVISSSTGTNATLPLATNTISGLVTLGTSAGTVVEGNDERIVNATPNTRTLTGGDGILIDNTSTPQNLTTNRTIAVDNTVVRTNNTQTITGLKTIQIAGPSNGTASTDVLNFGIGTDILYRLSINNIQNPFVPTGGAAGDVVWYFTSRFNKNGNAGNHDLLSFHRGLLVTGDRLASRPVYDNLVNYYLSNPNGRYPITSYHVGNQQYENSIIIGSSSGLVNASNGTINVLANDIKLKVYGKGDFTDSVTSSNFITSSDIRIKSDIKPIENALDTISKFISYEYKKNGIKEAGFIAQEVKEVLPYAVFEDNDNLLTMSDRPILAYLHKAILELKEEIEKIKR